MALALSSFRRRLAGCAASALRHRRRLSLSPIPDPAGDSRFLQHAASDPPSAAARDHSPFLASPAVRVSSLPGGIRVVTQPWPAATRMASVGVWIDAGSRFEAPGTNGTAHFLEHMIFKGTNRRTAQSLEVEIENMGANLNAYTSREQTTFFADVRGEDLPVSVDILADILQNSRFPDHAIKRERGVILRELQEVQGQTEEVIFDHLHSAAFPDHPLGDTILGPEENIKSISKADLHEYIFTHYTAPRMVVSAAGAVEHDTVVNLVGSLFKRFSTSSVSADMLVRENPAIFNGSEVRVENADLPLAHLAIAFKGTAWIDPYSIPLMVMQCMLGTWNKGTGVDSCSGSKLAWQVSKNNLAERIMAFNTNYRDTGLFGVYVTTTPDCLHDLSRVLMQEITRLAYEVSEEEAMRARNQLKTALTLHLDGSTSVSENNGRQMLTYGRVIPFAELFARIDAVDAETIKETAREFVLDKDVSVAALGPIQNLPEHNWFRSQTGASYRQVV